MSKIGQRAIVCGASMAGLLAARAPSEFYETVTLVERDRMPDGPEQRRGVPQGWHLYALAEYGLDSPGRAIPGPARRTLPTAGATVLGNQPSRVYVRSGRHELSPFGPICRPGIAGLISTQPTIFGVPCQAPQSAPSRMRESWTGHDVVEPIADRADRVRGRPCGQPRHG